MWRMRGLLKRILLLNNPQGFFIDWHKKDHVKEYLVDIFVGDEYLIDFRTYFSRKFYRLFNKTPNSSVRSLGRAREHRERITRVFDACIKRGYLEPIPVPHLPHTTGSSLRMTQDGIEFIEWLRFFNTFFSEKEYGKISAFIFGVVGTGIVGFILANRGILWFNWTNWLSKLLY